MTQPKNSNIGVINQNQHGALSQGPPMHKSKLLQAQNSLNNGIGNKNNSLVRQNTSNINERSNINGGSGNRNNSVPFNL